MAEELRKTSNFFKPCWRCSIISYIVLAGLFTVGVYVFYHVNIANRIRDIEASEGPKTGSCREIILREFEQVIGDIRFLSNHNEIHDYLANPCEATRKNLAREYASFAEDKYIYDQVRFLDADGMEVVRINAGVRHSRIVPENELQPKGDRYYFQESIRLHRGEVYISRLDLNIENGAIEQPLKPMIRFGMSVYDNNGRRRGVVILNYKAESLLSLIRNASASGTGELMLVNSDGYWMCNRDREKEWGWQLEGRSNFRFNLQYPAAWKKICGTKSGYFRDDSGIFMFESLSLKEAGSKLQVPIAVSSCADHDFCDDSSKWILVAHVPGKTLAGIERNKLKTLLPFWGGAMVALLIPAWAIDIVGDKWRTARRELKNRGHIDKVTGLATRALFLDRLEVTFRQALRYNRLFGMMFVDLDGFKSVNDSLGHDAGDAVLKETGSRLKACVRQADTVARYGGDEFTIILSEMQDVHDAAAVAEKMLFAVRQPIDVEGREVAVSASIGISVYPMDGDGPETLLKCADDAMYAAKQAGKGCCRCAKMSGEAMAAGDSFACVNRKVF